VGDSTVKANAKDVTVAFSPLPLRKPMSALVSHKRSAVHWVEGIANRTPPRGIEVPRLALEATRPLLFQGDLPTDQVVSFFSQHCRGHTFRTNSSENAPRTLVIMMQAVCPPSMKGVDSVFEGSHSLHFVRRNSTGVPGGTSFHWAISFSWRVVARFNLPMSLGPEKLPVAVVTKVSLGRVEAGPGHRGVLFSALLADPGLP